MFLINLIKGHYNINISNKVSFSKDRNLDYNLRNIDSFGLVVRTMELIVTFDNEVMFWQRLFVGLFVNTVLGRDFFPFKEKENKPPHGSAR